MKTNNQKPKKEWIKKWVSEGISNTLFLWIYTDHINWTLHEDAPWKDTIETEVDQTIEEYKTMGPPEFITDMFNDKELKEINILLKRL